MIKNIEPSLSHYRVQVIEKNQSSKRGWVPCEIGEDIQFNTEGLEAYCFTEWNSLVFDAFVLAGAIQFCDQTKARSSIGWKRSIELKVPVHDPAHWNSDSVSMLLHDAISFLTGDEWQIKFTARRKKAESSPQSNIDLASDSYTIMPFSDGLDSAAVSGLMSAKYGQQLILVRLGKKSNLPGRSRSTLPFAYVPYKVKGHRTRVVESSARSRGFKFALLTGIAAYLANAKDIIVAESGQGALGPVLVPVGQTYEDLRNHPLFTEKMKLFIRSLFGHQVNYVYPRIWNTKATTLREYKKLKKQTIDLALTRSCWQGQRQASVNGKLRQCGICAACMLRRMSMNAADIDEKKESYVWENLSSSRFQDGAASAFNNKKAKGSMYQYAIAGTLHMDHLAGIRNSKANALSIKKSVFQLSQALKESEVDVEIKLDSLLKEHEREWNAFLASLSSDSFIKHWTNGAS